MRRLMAILTLLLTVLLGLPATAQAAPSPIGGGTLLLTSSGAPLCRVAFAARAGAAGYLVASRACGPAIGAQLYAGPSTTLVGPVVAVTQTHSLVYVSNAADWQLVPWIPVGGGQLTITGMASTPIGGSVCLIDTTVGMNCGMVQAKNQTLNFGGGLIHGVTRTNICPSTGPVAYVSGSQAQGVPLLLGSGSCTTGGTTYFFPITSILPAYGLTLLTG